MTKKAVKTRMKVSRLDAAKLKIPIERKYNEKILTTYRDRHGKFTSKTKFYQSFKTKDGIQLTPDEVDFLIVATLTVNDAKDVYTLFETQLNETSIYTDLKEREMVIDFGLLSDYIQDSLITHTGNKIKPKHLQMGYLDSLKNDAIETIENRFSSVVKICNIDFEVKLNPKSMTMGDFIIIKIYGEYRRVGKDKTEKVGVYKYAVATGKVYKQNTNDYWN